MTFISCPREGGVYFLILLLCLVISCKDKLPKLILASFESEKELKGLVWECGRWFEITESHATLGRLALKVDIFPKSSSKEPIFRVFLSEKDWSSYNCFSVDVFNFEQIDVPLTIRFIDKDSNEDPGKFYSKIVSISPGQNHINIPVAEIKQGPEKRNLKLHKMSKIAFLVKDFRQKHSLYFDNIVLTR